ncbi:MAG: hypothetical protein IPL92_11265 [Saprospiraceae bacterium]|nr:hypothetical protein [Candidatus Opimibacter iunctus]
MIWLLSVVLLILSNKDFPDKSEVLVAEFAGYENFFPLATLDLRDRGIKDKIHIIYVSFNYSGPWDDPNFPDGEDMDHFTFKIEKGGLYRPTFDKKALVIEPRYQPFFDQGKEIYAKVKSENQSIRARLNMRSRPDWLQNDATPYNSKNEPYTFICQFEMEGLFLDDSWIYVFYDKADRQVKYVHQRT